jgi:hypothetical protein
MTVFTESGTLGGYSIGRKYCYRIGRLVYIEVYFTITSVGTAGGWLGFSLPFEAVAGSNKIIAGRENNVTGAMLQGRISGTVCRVWTHTMDRQLLRTQRCMLVAHICGDVKGEYDAD